MKVDPDRLAELEEERSFLLRSLDDLERERHARDLDDGDYTELRDGYITRAAAVLREIDDGRARLAPRPPRRWGRTLAIGGGLLALAVGAGVAMAFAAGQRLPGATVSGNTAETVNTLLAEARSLEATDPKGAIDRFEQVLKIEPDNAEALTYRRMAGGPRRRRGRGDRPRRQGRGLDRPGHQPRAHLRRPVVLQGHHPLRVPRRRGGGEGTDRPV